MNWFGLVLIVEISFDYLQHKQKALFTEMHTKEAETAFYQAKTCKHSGSGCFDRKVCVTHLSWGIIAQHQNICQVHCKKKKKNKKLVCEAGE